MTLFELICAGIGRTFERPRRRNRRGDFGRNADCLESRQLMTFVTPGGFETEPNDSLAAADLVSVVSTNRELTSRFQGVCRGPLDTQDVFRLDLTEPISSGTVELKGLRDDLNVQVRDTRGQVLGTGVNTGTTPERIQLRNLAAGTYFIRIYSESPKTRSVYTATFSGTKSTASGTAVRTGDSEPNDSRLLAVSAGEISTDVPTVLHGGLFKSDQQDWYQVSMPAGGTVTVSLTEHTQDLDLEIQDEQGRTLAVSDQGGTAGEQIRLEQLLPGTYYVRVHRFRRQGSLYSLAILRSVPAVGRDSQINDDAGQAELLDNLPPGESVSLTGSLFAADRQDWYQVNAGAGSAMTVGLSGLVEDLDLEILNSNGKVVRSSSSGGVTGEQISLQNLAAGEYFIRVFSYGRAQSSYRLETQLTPAGYFDAEPNNRRTSGANVGTVTVPSAAAQPAQSSEVAAGGLRIAGSLHAESIDWYRFAMESAGRVTIDVFGSSGNSTRLTSPQLKSGNYCIRVSRVGDSQNFVVAISDQQGLESDLATVQSVLGARSSYSLLLSAVP